MGRVLNGGTSAVGDGYAIGYGLTMTLYTQAAKSLVDSAVTDQFDWSV